jgi:hypothetical protein
MGSWYAYLGVLLYASVCAMHVCLLLLIHLFPPQLLYSEKEKKSVTNLDNNKYLVVWTLVAANR